MNMNGNWRWTGMRWDWIFEEVSQQSSIEVKNDKISGLLKWWLLDKIQRQFTMENRCHDRLFPKWFNGWPTMIIPETSSLLVWNRSSESLHIKSHSLTNSFTNEIWWVINESTGLDWKEEWRWPVDESPKDYWWPLTSFLSCESTVVFWILKIDGCLQMIQIYRDSSFAFKTAISFNVESRRMLNEDWKWLSTCFFRFNQELSFRETAIEI